MEVQTQATPDNILKYYNALKKLHNVLQLTDKISMLKFSEQNKISKSLSTVLQRGGVIKLNGKGRATSWEWSSIEPTREMAIRVLKELAIINPPRETSCKIKNRGGKREGAGRKAKSVENRYLESYTIRMFFGLVKINIKLNYKQND